MSDEARLLRIRQRLKKRRPEFKRQESWKYKRLSEAWRRPKGIDNKVKKKKKGFIKMPGVGYRSPAKVRGYHPTGRVEALVENVEQLSKLEAEKTIVRLSSKLGMRKKTDIIQKAQELGFRIANLPVEKEEEPEKWKKLTELETEEIAPELDEKYVKEIEAEGSLEGLPEYEVESETEAKKTRAKGKAAKETGTKKKIVKEKKNSTIKKRSPRKKTAATKKQGKEGTKK